MGLLKGRPAPKTFNFRGPSFKQLGFSGEALSDDSPVGLMPQEPRLIRRPVARIEGGVYFSADRAVLESFIS